MFQLIKNADIYAPEPLGKKDILICGEQIIKIDDEISVPESLGTTTVTDLDGKKLVPGFIDYHNHYLGGGGGAGFASRVPPMTLTRFTTAGITTTAGALGYDSTTRQIEGLYGLAKALEEEGMTTYIYCGHTVTHPAVTITGSIITDIIFIDKVMGLGEISLSELGPGLDTMGPGTEYIAKAATEAMLASRLAKKPGIVILQVPTVKRGLEPLFEIIEKTGIPASQFVPAHANKYEWYLDQNIKFAKMGGTLDVTTSYSPSKGHPGSLDPEKAVKKALDEGVSIRNITMTSDGNGGGPVNDENGDPVAIYYLGVDTLLPAMVRLHQNEGVELSDALRTITANPARILKIDHKKGGVREGLDADLVSLDDNFKINHVFARGRLMVEGGKAVRRGMWEDMLEGKTGDDRTIPMPKL